jgi:hypothetical protein
MKLIPTWKKAWRMFSVQAMTLATALQGAWMAVPAELQTHVPSVLVHILTIVLLVAGVFGRLVTQPGVSE